MSDAFYTAPLLAKHLLSFAKEKEVRSVADFCAGEGNLLIEALRLWPNVKCFATDIKAETCKKLKKIQKRFKIAQCDFLNTEEKKSIKIFHRKYDLILLNPPFSCRGGIKENVTLNQKTFAVSKAMAFLIESFKYLHKDGEILAILPRSVAYSQKDYQAWQYLSDTYNLTVLDSRDNESFNTCAPNLILVSLSFQGISDQNITSHTCISLPFSIKLFRGKFSMCKVDRHQSEGYPLIHSTNLRKGEIADIKYYSSRSSSCITGPAVLIPRVGQPSMRKISFLERGVTFALSDCVIAIQAERSCDCKFIIKELVRNWRDFSSLYQGTGAKYITLRSLQLFFNNG